MKKYKIILSSFVIIVVIAMLIHPHVSPKAAYRTDEGRVFGTYYHVTYESKNDLHSFILRALDEVDACLSMFNDSSTISRINRNESVTTDSLFELLYAEARRISELSDGAFDITVAPLVNLWGFGKGTYRTNAPDSIVIDSILTYVGYRHILLDNHRIVKDDPRIVLDASAIAKGLGCDCVARALEAHGVMNYLVEVGGEVVLRGVNAQSQPWRVGITTPSDTAAENDYQTILSATYLNMATSGNYRQYYYINGTRRSHTIDPRTGFPVQHPLLSATVLAHSCMEADALATACMVLGAEPALKMIAQLDDAACYLIIADGDSIITRQSPNWHDYVTK